MIPGISVLIPIYLLAIKVKLLNSYVFMILVYGAWLVRFLLDTPGVWWGQFMAFTTLAIAPILLTFFVLQKRYIEGLTSGGIKG